MPTLDPFTYSNTMQESKRRRAWEAHYEKKGCTPSKARDVAWNKCKSKLTWPPQ